MPYCVTIASRQLGRFLEVVARAGRDVAELDLFCKPSAERHRDLREQLFLRAAVAIVFRKRPRDAHRHPARNDRHLVHRIRFLGHPADDGVPRLVVGSDFLFFLRHHDRLALRADHDAVDRLVAVVHLDDVLVAARGEQRGLVQQVLEIGAREARRALRKRFERDFVRERLVARVHFEDLLDVL